MQLHTVLNPRHSLEELRGALTVAREPLFKTRLKAIILRKQDKSPQEIALQLMVSDRSVTSWVLRYNEGGLPTLHTKPAGRPGGNPVWDQEIFDDLAHEIDKGGYWSIPCMQKWIKDHRKESIPEQTIWYRMNRLKYSYKSSRPSPIGGNKEKREAFKKGALLHSWSR